MSDPAAGNGAASIPTPRPKRNRAWVWYFAILVVLTVLAAGTLVAYNLRQQLKPEQLEKARKHWEQKGPTSYIFAFTKRLGDSGEAEEVVVRVRDRKVESVTLNGRPLEDRLKGYYDMAALFDQIEENLERDAKPDARRAYVRAQFDPHDGHLLYYVRRVMGFRPIERSRPTERVEIHVERFEPLP
jgi:hypothetical protein